MIVREAYSDVEHRICVSHYHLDASRLGVLLGPVQDSRETGCEWCGREQEDERVLEALRAAPLTPQGAPYPVDAGWIAAHLNWSQERESIWSTDGRERSMPARAERVLARLFRAGRVLRHDYTTSGSGPDRWSLA